jgi:glycosyltransferase involved in cell wall biosynthesis
MKKLLVIGYVWPEPNSSAAGYRMMQLLSLLQQHNYDITYSSAAVFSEHSVDLPSLGIHQHSIEVNSSSFNDFIKQLSPDVVLFDRFIMEEQFSWRVDDVCPQALKILETVDLHSLRDARHTAVKNNISPYELNNLDFYTDTAVREVASILRCDLSLMISEVEIEILKNKYQVDESLLFYLPFMFERLEEGKIKSQWKSFKQRQYFVTIGTFRHAPNWDSVLYLKNTLWPAIHKHLKHAELHIYGSYLPKKAQQLHNPQQGFYIKGWADDAIETLSQYRVCLSPLRFGAGMKGKLADAMLTGTPSVTTSIGAESMNGKHAWPGFIMDDENGLVNAAIELYENETLWQEKNNNILPIVNERFNKEKYGKDVIHKINELVTTLEEHRKKNFIGKMLRHHTMKSAMYMSQWIEAKNKPVKL